MPQTKINNSNPAKNGAGAETSEGITAPETLTIPADQMTDKPPKKIIKSKGLNSGKGSESLAFTEHEVPSDEEIRDEEIEESLLEIYQDDKGGMVNVSKLDKIKRHGFLYYLLVTILTLAVIGSGGWAAYKYIYLPSQSGVQSVELSVDAPKDPVSGQEFVYTINYKNLNNVDLKSIEIMATYPDNFVFLESSPPASQKNNIWQVDGLGAHRSGKIEVKGKIVGPQDEVAVILADMSYVPVNFTSEFKKEVSFQSVVSGVGIDFSFDSQNSVLVNELNQIAIKYQPSPDNNYLDNFRLTVTGSDNSFVLATSTSAKTDLVENPTPGVWLVKKMGKDSAEIDVKFKFKDKLAPSEDVTLTFEYSTDGNLYNKFLEKQITFNILKNDLNLNLILNGSRNDQGIDFGQTLSYSIVYANKGEEDMKDVVIMAVLNSDILDWSALADANRGQVRGNTISWTKDEIPSLGTLAKDNEGTIDFSIKVSSLDKIKVGSQAFDPNGKYEVQSYAQFSIGNKDAGASDDTKSNIILGKINSDLKLDEQVRYFNDDNIAVGSGPLPPKVGQTTSFRVFWTITNNLHELNGVKAEAVLPQYVNWDNRVNNSVGSLQFDSNTRKVTWDIGRLPMDISKISADFSISITPKDSDADTIMVLMPGTTIDAVDNVTNAEINKTTKAETTKLEDDSIANSDGRVIR